MIKKILPISVFVLILIIIILLGLQSMLGKANNQGASTITPTVFQGRQGSGYNPQTGKTSFSSIKQFTPEEFQKKLPIIAPDFILDRSDRLQKYVVTLKTDNGLAAYGQWLDRNQSFSPLLLEGQVIVTRQTINDLHDALDYAEKNKLSPQQEFKKNQDSLLDIVNTLFMPIAAPQEIIPIPTPSSVPTPTEKPKPTVAPQANVGGGGYVYYAQCGGAYDNYLLPIQNGIGGKKCTVCATGCGPTTAAMILSSYVSPTFTPPVVIEAMDNAGVSISCNGTGVYDIYKYMSNVAGIRVSSIMRLGHVQANDVVNDFRKYIEGGWTLFILADAKYGGHFFWVTGVSGDGQILAYDPAYGSGKPTPFNENQYNPYPYYLYAFGVKKSS